MIGRSPRLLPLALSLALAACTTAPVQSPAPPAPVATPAAAPLPGIAADSAPPAPAPATDLWDRLRSSFAMPDCSADASVLAWARRYTRHPAQFEDALKQALPRLEYVQNVAAQYDVPGEFALLPWVESRYRPVHGRHHAAGMWQIMPVTARSMGLRVDRHYDGRLDMPAAAHAVMKLLQQYHDHFHDWRVADYAYNAGEFKIRGLVRRHGMPAATPVIPDLPVRRVTREHLTQLLAIACVVREPARFQVSLPTLPASERLVQTPLPQAMTMARAARLAGMSEAALRKLNPALDVHSRGTMKLPYLMLPARQSDRFRSAQQSGNTVADEVARSAKETPRTRAPHTTQATHVVSSGESLWQIAREYSISVARLEQLNDLTQDQPIQPGQVLRLDDMD